MANEDAAQGIDDILDDIPETEPQPADVVPEPEAPAVETPEAEPESQPEPEAEATEEPAESLEEAESQVAKLFSGNDNVDHSGKTVPVDKHIALRQRAKNAEAERDALLAQQANVDTSVLDELAGLLEGDGDDIVDKDTLKQVVAKLPQAINNIAQQNINQVVQTNNTQNLIAKIKSDEAAFRKDNADYDAVTNFVSSRNLISDAERQAVFSSPDTAKALYDLGQQKIAEERKALGIAEPSTPQPKIDNTPAGDPPVPEAETNDEFEPIGDDEAFAMFEGGGQTP